jgi:hypothetical protein
MMNAANIKLWHSHGEWRQSSKQADQLLGFAALVHVMMSILLMVLLQNEW